MSSVARLTPPQKAMLLNALSAEDDETEVGRLVDSRLAQLPICPHCAGTWIVRSGSASGLQRYKCRTCQRTFNALSKTPLARLRMKAK
jgi:transposase-like protein